ncbi:MAG: dTMP kinase [Sphingomonadaceae bacterium]
MTGRFITLEGGEGVGKTTQLRALAAALSNRGYKVITTREPGGSAGAEAIRDLVMNGSQDRWSAQSEALLFAAARADHVERVIRPALERGEWVLCDRFIDSTRAYQGGAGGLDDSDIMALHRVGSDGLMPDRTLVLSLSEAQALARARARDGNQSDRFGDKNFSYHQRVSAAFEHFSATDPDRVRLVSAVGDAEQVTQRLLAQLSDLL